MELTYYEKKETLAVQEKLDSSTSINMSKNHIKLHKPNKEVFPVRTSLCSSNDVLDFLPKLLRQSRVSLAPGFWIEFGVSFETHVFIARESRVDPNCLMDVFALEVRNGGKARLDEVFNSARSTFAHVFGAEDSRTSLTVYSYPDSCSADGESKCVNLVLFTLRFCFVKICSASR